MDKKILVVDDNEEITSVVKEEISALNPEWEVNCATSGKECIATLENNMVDLVLLDIMMPGMNGWDVVAEMKKNEKMKSIPVVFLTAKTDNLSKAMGKLSAEEYICKPFDIMKLNETVRNVLIK